MFYNSSKIRGRSTELVGALFKGPRLKLLIGGALLLAVAVTAALAGIFTNISEAQQSGTNYVGFVETGPIRVKEDVERIEIRFGPDMVETSAYFVNIDVMDGTAEENTHFTLNSKQYVISGDNPWAVVVLPMDNEALDGPRDKNFFLELSEGAIPFPDGVELHPTRSRIEVIIEDDDDPTTAYIGFDESTLTVREGVGATQSGSRMISRLGILLTVEGEGGVASQIPMGKQAKVEIVSIDGGTAEEGTHFTFFEFTNTERTFDQGTGNSSVPLLEIVDDNARDGARANNFFLELKFEEGTPIPPGVAIDPNRNRLEVIIVDDDNPAKISFQEPETYIASVSENRGEVTLVVRNFGGSLAENITAAIRLNIMGDTGTDFATSMVDFEYTQQSGDLRIPISILDDDVFEGDETFTVVLSASPDHPLPPGVQIGQDRDMVKIKIENDDEQAVVGLSSGTYTVREDEGSLTIPITNYGGGLAPGVPLNLRVRTIDGTAGDLVDIMAVDEQIELNDQIKTKDISIQIVDDSSIDGDKTFEVVLSPVGSLPFEVELDPEGVTATVTIVDDESPARIGFESTTYSVIENKKSVTVTIRNFGGDLAADTTATLILDTMDNTAMAGEDYEGISDRVIQLSDIDQDSLTLEIPITILDNTTIEDAKEMFSLVLSEDPNKPLPSTIELDQDQDTTAVTVLDGDLTLGFVSTSYLILENGGQQEVLIQPQMGSLAEPITVRLRTEDGDAEAPADYIHTEMDVVVSPDAVQKGIVIPINLDRIAEGTERFYVVLEESPLTPLPVGIALNPSAARTEVAINDEIILTIGFVGAPFTFDEGDANASINVAILSEGVVLDDDFKIGYTITGANDGDAARDFQTVSATLTFSSKNKSLNILEQPIIEDLSLDGDRTYMAALNVKTIGPNVPAVQLNPSTAMITVVDKVQVGFKSTKYEVDEGDGRVAITFGIYEDIDLSAEADLTVRYSTSDDAANKGDDYIETAKTFTFTADMIATGMTETTIYVDVTDDSVVENEESFLVTLLTSDSRIEIFPPQTTVTLNDNDVPGITVRNLDGDLYEDSNDGMVRASFEVALTDARVASEQLTIGLAARAAAVDDGGTAADVRIEEFGGVFYHDITSVMLDIGETSTTFFVSRVDDDEVEFDETVNIYVTTITGQHTTQAGISITDSGADVRIFSDDKPQATLTVEDWPEGGTTIATIDLSGVVLPASTPTGALRLVLQDGSTMNADVEIVSTDIVAALKEDSTVRVPIILTDDDLAEGDETVVVELRIDSTLMPDLADVLTVGTDSFTITDDEPRPEVGFFSAAYTDYEVNEADSEIALTFGIVNNVKLPEGVTLGVRYITSDGSATLADGDYEAVDQTVDLSSDKTEETIRVTITDDSVLEDDETFQVILSSTDGRVNLARRHSTAVTILNDDTVPVGLGSPRYGVFEDDGVVRVAVNLLDPSLLPMGESVDVNYRIEAGSAVAGVDYTDMSGMVTLSAAEPSKFIEITIIDNAGPGVAKSFRVVLDDNSKIELTTAEALVEILNDDIVTIGFEMAEYEVDENGGVLMIDVVSDVSIPVGGVTLAVSTVVGTATAGDDYTAVNKMEVVIPAEDTDQTLNITIANDGLIEPDETFFVELGAPDGGLPSWVELDHAKSRVPVKIESEDTASAVFIIPSEQVNEGATHASTIQLLNGNQLAPGYEVTVYYGISRDLSSATAGEDYTLEGVQSVTFSSSSRFGAVNIPTIDDALDESDEIFVIELLRSSDPDIQLGGQKRVTIVDNDSVTVDFIGPDSYTVNEGDGPVAIKFGIIGDIVLASNATVGVSYATSADTAFEADDYTPVSGTVILTADMPEVTIEIPIIDDSKPEGDEQFVITGNFGGASGPAEERTITIKDDDQGTIRLVPANRDVTEGNASSIRFNLEADPPLSGIMVTLNYVVESDSATAGDDYTNQSGMVTLNSDLFLDIGIVDDSVPESFEHFVVRLSLPEGSELPPGYSLGPDPEVTIIDDDGATLIGFTQAAYEVEESSGTVSFEIEVDAGGVLAEAVTLDYAIEDGSAKLGTDYNTPTVNVSTAGTIELTPAVPTATITVKIIDGDRVAEYDKAFRIRLSESGSTPLPAGIELYRDSAEITIVNDDDVTIGFQETTYRVDEDAGSVEATIAVLTGSLADNTEITVRYSTSDDTAIAGQDYTAVSDVLTFTQNNIQQRISIPVINDDRYEVSNAERFLITISDISENPISGLTEAPAEAEVLIRDNEGPGDLEIRLLPENIRVRENAGTDMTLRATIPFPFDEDLELTLDTYPDMDPNTLDSSAYELFATTVIIPMGDTSVAIGATVSDNIIAGFDKVLLVGVTQLDHSGISPYDYPLAERPSAAVTIVDDDTLILNVELDETPDEGEAQVCVTWSNPLDFDGSQVLTLEVRDANGELYTETISDQYGEKSMGIPVPFAPIDGDTQGCIDIDFENNFYEGVRAYTIMLIRPSSGIHDSVSIGDGFSHITVAENDLPELALNYGGTREVAEGQGIDVELELTNGAPEGLHEPLTVRLALTETSTASTSDVSFPTSVTIPRGKNSVPFKITARDDMLDGEIEQFELALVSASAPSQAENITRAVFNSGGAIAVTEAPVPQVTLSLEGGISTIMEGGSVNLIATLAEPLPDGVPEPLTVELAVEGVSSGDYSLPGDIVIGMGDTTGMVELTIIDDNLAEFAEQLTIKVAQLGYGTNRSTPQVESSVDLTIEIDNNDRITATITAPNTDEDGTVSVGISLNLALPSGLNNDEVKLVLGGTDRTADVKSGLPANIATDLTGDRMATVMVPLEDDDILEGTEEVTLMLELSDRLKPHFTNADSTSGSFNINDNEDGTVIIATPVKTAYDENENIVLTVKLPSGVNAGAPITVDYEISFPKVGTTAQAEGADIITTTSGEVTIAANANSVPLTIMLNDDDVLEETELLRVTLTDESTTNGADVMVGGQPVDLTILDDEDLTYVIEGDAAINEDAGNYTVQLRRTGDITADATVPYTVDGTDVTAADFGGTGMFPSGSFTFMGNEALSAEVSIPIADDMILEPDETFQITADKAGAAETTHDVTINDDDNASAEVRLGTSSGTVAEDAMTTLEVALTNVGSGGAPENLTIQLSARAHTSDPDGGTAADVTIPATVMIPMGASSVPLMVSAVADGLVEYDETVNIYVSMVGSDSASDSGVDLTVTSADQITVESLRVATTSNTEGGMANVEITLSEALPSRTPANALSLVLSDATTYGSDVTIPVTDITQNLKTGRTVVVPVSLLEDDLLEADEEIGVRLQIASGQAPNLADVLDVSGANAMTSFTLSDADSGEVSIVALPKTPYNESEDVTVMVELSGGLTAGTDITVEYVLTYPSDAANAADVVGDPVPVTIMAGKTQAIFVIDLNDDSIAEETELVGVRLTRASGAAGTKVTHDGSVMQFRILDNEDPEYTLVGDGTVNEDSTSDGFYEVQARRRGRTDVLSVGYTVTVAASDSASAADFPSDMFPVGTFTFSGYDALSMKETIRVYDDMLLEDVENFLIVAGNAMHPVMLFDNDAPTVFVRYTQAVSSVTFNEDEMVELIAELQNAPNGATEELTVSLAAREVSGATDSGTPSDVEFPWWNAMTTPTITIPVGASKVTFAVKAVADGLAEYTETVNIYASEVSYSGGVNLTGDNGSELAVVSSDQVKATLTIPNGTEGTSVRAQITLDQVLPPRTPDGVLSLVLPDGRTTNDDVEIIYTDLAADLKTGTKTFVTINLKEDTRLEGDETVRVELRIDPGQSPDLSDVFPSVVEGSFKIIDNEVGMVSIVPPSVSEYYESVGGAVAASDVAETVDFEFKLPDGVIADIPVVVYYSMGIAEIGSGSETAFGPVLAPGFAQGLALPIRGFAQPARLSVTIPVGENRYVLTVTLPNDDKAEVTELLTIRLDDVETTAPGARAEVDQQMDETVIRILDDEAPVIELIAERSANEEDGSYKVRARRLGRINTNGEKVQISIVGDAADAGDFVGKLSHEVEFIGFNPVSSEIVLTLNDDRSQEDARTFRIEVMDSAGKSVPLVDSTGNSVTEFAVTLLDSDVADSFGALPPTGGPVLPIWLVLLLALTGVALLVPTLRRLI